VNGGPKADPLPWLLEPDDASPGARLFALRDLLDRPADDPEVIAAQAKVMRTGPVPAILDAQYPDGYWVKPGPGYSSKYRATLWQVLFLAQLGADGRDERVRRAVEYAFAHNQAESGAFSPRRGFIPFASPPTVLPLPMSSTTRRSATRLSWDGWMRSGFSFSASPAPGMTCSAVGTCWR